MSSGYIPNDVTRRDVTRPYECEADNYGRKVMMQKAKLGFEDSTSIPLTKALITGSAWRTCDAIGDSSSNNSRQAFYASQPSRAH